MVVVVGCVVVWNCILRKPDNKSQRTMKNKINHRWALRKLKKADTEHNAHQIPALTRDRIASHAQIIHNLRSHAHSDGRKTGRVLYVCLSFYT